MDRLPKLEPVANRDNFVKEVSPSNFWQIKYASNLQFQEIETDTWTECGLDSAVLNYGAGPCLIVFAIDNNVGRIISGHFSNTRRKDISNSGDSELLAEHSVENAYTSYLKMVSRLKTWGNESGWNNIALYLYGQNFGAYRSPDQSIKGKVDDETEHLETSNEISIITGIPIHSIKDYRQPDSNATDSIMFLPIEKRLYHTSH